MKKLVILAFCIALFANMGYSADIFTDGFESGTLTGWDVSAGWTAGGTARTGTYALYSGDVSALIYANRSIDTSVYSSMNVSFWAYTANLDAGEYVAFGWYNGSSWSQAMSVQTIASYAYYSFLLPPNASNVNFKIYFACLATGSGTETCTIDDVLLTGTAPPDTTPPNIASWKTNVTNNSYYSATQGYQFNATVIDNTAVDSVFFINNFSGLCVKDGGFEYSTDEFSNPYWNLAQLGVDKVFFKPLNTIAGAYSLNFNNSAYDSGVGHAYEYLNVSDKTNFTVNLFAKIRLEENCGGVKSPSTSNLIISLYDVCYSSAYYPETPIYTKSYSSDLACGNYTLQDSFYYVKNITQDCIMAHITVTNGYIDFPVSYYWGMTSSIDDFVIGFNTSTVGSSYFYNADVLNVGEYLYSWWTNDSFNNINISSAMLYAVKTETVPPNIANIKTNVTNNSDYSAGQRYQFNATISDASGLYWVRIEHNFSGILANYTVATASGSEYYYNYGELSAGMYRYRWFANDTIGNMNSTDVIYYYIKPDTSPPLVYSIRSNVSSGSEYDPVQGYQFNATVTDANLGSVWIRHNFSGAFQNYSVTSKVGNEYYYNAGVLEVGNYTYSWWANDSFLNLNTSGTYNYSVKCPPPTAEFVSQEPADISAWNILTERLNITYNFSGLAADYSLAALYSKVNSTASDRLIYINGSLYGGYSTHAESVYNSTPELFHFTLSDVSAYPAIYNMDETYMHHAPKLNYSLALPSQYIKTRFLNMSNSKLFGFLEFYAWNVSSGSGMLSAYYCNSSYVSGNPNVMDSCLSFGGVEPTAAYNHTYDTSKHYVIPFPVNASSGMIGDVYVTPVGYILLRSLSGGWNIAYISNITRAATVQISSSNGGTWSDFSGTTDMHLHQYDGTEQFRYFGSIGSLCDGTLVNSSARSDLINLGGMPPSAPFVYEPQSDSYYGTIMIAYTQALSPNSYGVTYNISLYYSNYTYAENLHYNAYNLTYVWDASDYTGSYIIMVNATDSNGLSAYGFSEAFNISVPPFVDAFMNCTILIDSQEYLPLQNGTLTAYNQLIPSYYGLYSQNGTLIYESAQIMDKGVQNYTFSAPSEQGAYYFKLVCNSELSSYAHFTVYQGFWDIPFEPLMLLFVGLAVFAFGYMIMRR